VGAPIESSHGGEFTTLPKIIPREQKLDQKVGGVEWKENKGATGQTGKKGERRKNCAFNMGVEKEVPRKETIHHSKCRRGGDLIRSGWELETARRRRAAIKGLRNISGWVQGGGLLGWERGGDESQG